MTWTTVSVTLSLLIGLSVARILNGLVSIFRARRRATLDWIPVLWAVILLQTLLETWSALNALPTLVPTFSFPVYLGLALMLMFLFSAASLLLPPGEIGAGENLKAYFAEEGRFALPLYAGFLAAGAVANVTLFQSPLMASWFWLDIVLIALPLIAFAVRSRRVAAAVTILYLPLSAMDIVVSLSG